MFGDGVGGTVSIIELLFGSYVGLFGSKADEACFFDSSWGGLISMARDRRLPDPGECGGGFTTGGRNGAGSALGKLGNVPKAGGYIIIGAYGFAAGNPYTD